MLNPPFHPTLLRFASYFLSCLFLFACISDNYREQGELTKQSEPDASHSGGTRSMYKDKELTLSVAQSPWKGNSNIKAGASIQSMKFVFNLDLAGFRKQMLPLSENKKDTFAETILHMEVLFNGRPIQFDIPDPDKGWLVRTSMHKSPGERMDFESGVLNLSWMQSLKLNIPLFVLSGAKAGTTGLVSVRVWQDAFIGPERKKSKKVDFGPEEISYYNDTLKTKLIDNTYSFAFTVPQIYRSDIICDSIILQDDDSWSPAGSDNTLWKSTYPDIYFSLSDLYDNPQNSSVTEKSTGKFTIGDTLSFYHYSPSEPFSITVYDYDVLSKDDVLGEWSGELGAFKNNASYSLKFGHVKPFFLRRKEFGQVNR